MAFERLINAFTSTPVLRHYDPTLPTRIAVYTLSTTRAGMLSLEMGGRMVSIAYCVKKFSGAEDSLPDIRQEALRYRLDASSSGVTTSKAPPESKSSPATRTEAIYSLNESQRPPSPLAISTG